MTEGAHPFGLGQVRVPYPTMRKANICAIKLSIEDRERIVRGCEFITHVVHRHLSATQNEGELWGASQNLGPTGHKGIRYSRGIFQGSV